jgi:hypothetical protein
VGICSIRLSGALDSWQRSPQQPRLPPSVGLGGWAWGWRGRLPPLLYAALLLLLFTLLAGSDGEEQGRGSNDASSLCVSRGLFSTEMLRRGVWWSSSLQSGGIPWGRQAVLLLKMTPSFNNNPLVGLASSPASFSSWSFCFLSAVAARELDADPFLLYSQMILRLSPRACGRLGVSPLRQEGRCYLLTCGQLHVPRLQRRECFLLRGGFFSEPVLSACLLLPVAGAVSLMAGRFSSTAAAKDLPLFAPSYSSGAETLSSRAPL